jgi:hypothetical protein
MQQQRELTRNPYENDKRIRGLGLVFTRPVTRLAQKLSFLPCCPFLLTFLGIQKSKKVFE